MEQTAFTSGQGRCAGQGQLVVTVPGSLLLCPVLSALVSSLVPVAGSYKNIRCEGMVREEGPVDNVAVQGAGVSV